ncbi:MAG: RiPP maturation radical SAM C-methyltransferase [Sphaerospermopsis kisseleviana]
MIDVCLVSMPYAAVERPSIALGLLKASLQMNGMKAEAIYPNLWFAEEIGLPKYQVLSLSRPELIMGEWTFSQVAFPDWEANNQEYLRDIAYDHPAMRQTLLWVRDRAAAFIDRVARAVLELNPRIVSCSSTFQQNCASLALLRRIRELNPAIATIMGGANCEGEMGLTLHQAFDWVDFICSGEGDELFSALCQQILTHGRELPTTKLPHGVIAPVHRQGLTVSTVSRGSVQNLDQIAIPDYDDYFQTLQNLGISTYIEPGIPIETSRGCWWGQKQHCSFCGLNGSGMTYRSKSPERVVKEFTTLAERYHLQRFFVVDNILDIQHIDTVLPILASLEQPYSIFYETKANLRKEQVQQLAQAGVQFIQPGIENMHDLALQLLKKGNIALMNVQLLKWAREFGILVDWNFLIGIPGESGEWYAEMVEWLPLIVHLQPPSAAYPIRYDRFSPYHENSLDYGLKLHPHKSYSYVYPFSAEVIAQVAYYFEDHSHGRNISSSSDWREIGLIPEHKLLQDCIGSWGELFWSPQPPKLNIIEDDGQRLLIVDTRPCAVASEMFVEGLAYQIYLACDRVLTQPELLRILKVKTGIDLSWDEVKPIVADLRSRQILLQINNRLLSLAVKEPSSLPDSKDYPGGSVDVRSYLQDHRKQSQPQQKVQSSLQMFQVKV